MGPKEVLFKNCSSPVDKKVGIVFLKLILYKKASSRRTDLQNLLLIRMLQSFKRELRRH
jgi:hypothetical protein